MRARLLPAVAALVAFGGSLVSGFHFDDYAIFSDPSLTSLWGWLQVWGLRQTRPLTYFTFWVNYQLGGRDALVYHLFNVALHIGVVLVAYECLRRLIGERAALVAAALFAVHPIQAEAVDYVWGRSIVLAALFCSAALLAWLDGRRWMAVVWFALALLSKEECVAFPLVLPLLDGQKGAWRKRAGWPQIGAMLGLAVLAGVRVLWALAVTPGAPAGAQAGISPWRYLAAQAVSVPRYLQLLAVPYGFTVDPAIPVPPVWLGAVVWVLIAAVAVWLWRNRENAAASFALAGLILLLPSSSVLPAADLAADRRLYLPLVCFAASAGLLLARLKREWVGTALVAVLTLVSVERTYVWMSDVRLWGEAVRRAPGKVRPKIQLSRSVPAGEALELLSQAAIAAPYDPNVATETGRVFLEENQPAAALREFGRALALDPRNAQNLNNRGVALEALGQVDAARMDFQRALAIDPGLAEARENLRKLSGEP